MAEMAHVDASFPKAWSGRIAYVISMGGSPPVLAVGSMALIAATFPGPRVWTLASVYVFLSIFLPLLYVFWLVHAGRITDIDIQLREQRVGPLVITIAAGGLSYVVLRIGNAPPVMAVVGLALWLETMIILIITLKWKVSMHSAAAAGAATLIWCIFGKSLPLLIGVPIIAWSRVRLRRHTIAQTIVGALLGITVFLAVIILATRP
ncbi:MAG: hypothetical protein JXD18_01270 [Anaerolineae bacterium]|nr:hypothetical protein [Anaerolineae bacterium]